MAERTPLYETAARAGAVFVEEAGWQVPAHFADVRREYEQSRTGATLFDLSHHGKVEVAGPDARAFLHNLTSADVRGLAPGATCEAFLLTTTAKVIAYLRLTCLLSSDARRAAFLLDLAPGSAERVLKHLDHYLISEQVEFADRTRELALLHVAGPRAAEVVRCVPPSVSAQMFRVDRLGLPDHDLYCPREEAVALWEALVQAGATPAGREAFEVLRVEAGRPAPGVDVDETTFAPEVGRTAEAICYTKGCYLGQEPVVMARDRGQVNRRLLGLKLSGGPAPHNSPVYRDGKEVGRVTSSVVSPRLGGIALAYLRRGNQEAGTVVEVDAAGERRTAEVATLPFGS
jgi:folate-binding protein YgfZ